VTLTFDWDLLIALRTHRSTEGNFRMSGISADWKTNQHGKTMGGIWGLWGIANNRHGTVGATDHWNPKAKLWIRAKLCTTNNNLKQPRDKLWKVNCLKPRSTQNDPPSQTVFSNFVWLDIGEATVWICFRLFRSQWNLDPRLIAPQVGWIGTSSNSIP
jgi:hypothetical protein